MPSFIPATGRTQHVAGVWVNRIGTLAPTEAGCSTLRACPETSGWIAEFSEHEPNRGKAQECERLAVEVLPILGEPAAAIEPCDGTLDNPAFGHHDKSGNSIGTFHDFNVEMRENFRKSTGKLRSLIAAVGEQRLQERKHPKQRRHDENAAIAILNVGRMHDRMQQQT